MTIYFFHLPPNLSHLYPLQVENCDSNSRLVVDEDDNDTCIFRLEKVSLVLHFKNHVHLDLRINSMSISSYTMQLEWRTTMKLPSTAGLYVAFRTIMIISRQKKS